MYSVCDLLRFARGWKIKLRWNEKVEENVSKHKLCALNPKPNTFLFIVFAYCRSHDVRPNWYKNFGYQDVDSSFFERQFHPLNCLASRDQPKIRSDYKITSSHELVSPVVPKKSSRPLASEVLFIIYERNLNLLMSFLPFTNLKANNKTHGLIFSHFPVQKAAFVAISLEIHVCIQKYSFFISQVPLKAFCLETGPSPWTPTRYGSFPVEATKMLKRDQKKRFFSQGKKF